MGRSRSPLARRLTWVLSVVIVASMVCSLMVVIRPPRSAAPTPPATTPAPTSTPVSTPEPAAELEPATETGPAGESAIRSSRGDAWA